MSHSTALTAGRTPSAGRLLAAQIVYQARLLASGRALTIGVGLPVLLLISSQRGHGHPDPSVVSGYAVFGLTLTAWNVYGVRLVAAREAGVLKRWRATPLPRWCYFAGRILAAVVVAVAGGAATLGAGVLVYHLHLTVGSAVSSLVVFALGGLAWAAAATALTAAIPTVEAASPTLLLSYFVVITISGVFGSINDPHWLATLASYLPAEPLVHGATSALRASHGAPELPLHDLAVLAAWAVGGLAAALALFRWEPHRPARPAGPRPGRAA